VDDGEVGGDGDTFARTRLRAEYPVTKGVRLDLYYIGMAVASCCILWGGRGRPPP
jgi:hypothetical protein